MIYRYLLFIKNCERAGKGPCHPFWGPLTYLWIGRCREQLAQMQGIKINLIFGGTDSAMGWRSLVSGGYKFARPNNLVRGSSLHTTPGVSPAPEFQPNTFQPYIASAHLWPEHTAWSLNQIPTYLHPPSKLMAATL